METSIEEYLINKDLIVSSRGGVFYSTLLEEVVYEMMNGKSNKEIRKELPNIARDYYAAYFHIDRNIYFSEMKKFVFEKRRKSKRAKQETLEDKLISMGREYLVENNYIVEKTRPVQKCKQM